MKGYEIMLNSINNTSPSFGASLEYKGMTDDFGKDLSPSSQVKIVNDGIAEDMEHQGQNQNHQKQKGIDHADGPGIEIPPVLRHPIHGVESLQQSVDPLTG